MMILKFWHDPEMESKTVGVRKVEIKRDDVVLVELREATDSVMIKLPSQELEMFFYEND